jgi:hypothetical protein
MVFPILFPFPSSVSSFQLEFLVKSFRQPDNFKLNWLAT